MKKPNWDRLIQLNGGKKILYVEPRLDTKNEVWFYDTNSALVISSNATLITSTPGKGLGPVTNRATLYMVARALVVDVEVRNQQAVVRRGVLNGSYVENVVTSNEVPALLDNYRKLGFRDGTPWHATPKRVLVRDLRKGTAKWTVHVDGSSVFENWRTEHKQKSRDAAIAFATSLIVKKEKLGFVTRLIELTDAKYANPAASAQKPQALPPPTSFPKPTTAFQAVDIAVAKLRDLHQRFNKYHFVAECLDLPKEKPRLEELTQSAVFFTKLHRGRVDRWQTAKTSQPKKGESSWDYFVRVYGSITWILDTEVDRGTHCFYCGNVAGGGWSPLEISADQYDIKGLIKAFGTEAPPGLEQLTVFHGGWHHDRGFAFDRRSTSATGEFAIIAFDEGNPHLPKVTPAAKIVPFGTWLLKRVAQLTKTAEANIGEIW
jgi:hypothetical protein